MADLVVQNGIGYKRRNPWGVFGLSLITIGIYQIVWYYKINNELNNHGEQNNPTSAVLATTIGAVIVVPLFVSFYNTATRILQAQERSGASERIIPILGLLLLAVASVFVPVYYQSQLNKVWDALAAAGAEVHPA